MIYRYIVPVLKQREFKKISYILAIYEKKYNFVLKSNL
jgi:hypothetical protein